MRLPRHDGRRKPYRHRLGLPRMTPRERDMIFYAIVAVVLMLALYFIMDFAMPAGPDVDHGY
jgi:hypothetical protein